MQDDARGLDKGDARDARLSGPKKLRFREQDHVRKQMSKDAIEKCHVTRDAYIECARGRTFSLPFMCRGEFKEFNECLKAFTTEEEFNRRMAEFVPKHDPRDAPRE